MVSWLIISLFLVNIFTWGLLIRSKTEGTGLLGSLFPYKFILNKFDSIPVKVIALMVLYLWLHIIEAAAMAISGRDAIVYIVSFSIVILAELFILFRTASYLVKRYVPYVAGFAVFAGLVIAAAIYTVVSASYQPLNIIDFIILIVKVALCFFILGVIIIHEKIEKSEPIFVIVIGFAIFFVSHMFITGFQVETYLGNWSLVQVAFIVVLSFWLGGSFWLRKTWSG